MSDAKPGDAMPPARDTLDARIEGVGGLRAQATVH